MGINLNIEAEDFTAPSVDRSEITDQKLTLDELLMFPEDFIGKRVVLRDMKFLDFEKSGACVVFGLEDLKSGRKSQESLRTRGFPAHLVPNSVVFIAAGDLARKLVPTVATTKYAKCDCLVVVKPVPDDVAPIWVALLLDMQLRDEEGEVLIRLGFTHEQQASGKATDTAAGLDEGA